MQIYQYKSFLTYFPHRVQGIRVKLSIHAKIQLHLTCQPSPQQCQVRSSSSTSHLESRKAKTKQVEPATQGYLPPVQMRGGGCFLNSFRITRSPYSCVSITPSASFSPFTDDSTASFATSYRDPSGKVARSLSVLVFMRLDFVTPVFRSTTVIPNGYSSKRYKSENIAIATFETL